MGQVVVVAITDGRATLPLARSLGPSRPWEGEGAVDLKEEVIGWPAATGPWGSSCLGSTPERKFIGALWARPWLKQAAASTCSCPEAADQAIAAIPSTLSMAHLEPGGAEKPGPALGKQPWRCGGSCFVCSWPCLVLPGLCRGPVPSGRGRSRRTGWASPIATLRTPSMNSVGSLVSLLTSPPDGIGPGAVSRWRCSLGL